MKRGSTERKSKIKRLKFKCKPVSTPNVKKRCINRVAK